MPRSWSADIQHLENYARRRGHNAPEIGLHYGRLSGLAHPTHDAAENSAVLVVSRLRMMDPNDRSLADAIAYLEGEPMALLYRLVWLALESAGFGDLPVNEANVAGCVRFADAYPLVQPQPPGSVE
jgi:hypothetical protein